MMHNVRWSKPLVRWIKHNVDGVVYAVDGQGSIGGLIHDLSGTCLAGFMNNLGPQTILGVKL